jgi:hypothetical protein
MKDPHKIFLDEQTGSSEPEKFDPQSEIDAHYGVIEGDTGLKYQEEYSHSYHSRSLLDKGFIDMNDNVAIGHKSMDATSGYHNVSFGHSQGNWMINYAQCNNLNE